MLISMRGLIFFVFVKSAIFLCQYRKIIAYTLRYDLKTLI